MTFQSLIDSPELSILDEIEQIRLYCPPGGLLKFGNTDVGRTAYTRFPGASRSEAVHCQGRHSSAVTGSGNIWRQDSAK